MRIGVEATCWHNQRGYGRHLRSLIGALLEIDSGNTYELFADGGGMPQLSSPNAQVRVVCTARPVLAAASVHGHRGLLDLARMSRAMSAAKLDLLIFPTIYSYVPVVTRAKRMVFVHDVIAETYPALTTPGAASRLLWKMKSAAGRRQADAVVTVSDYSKRLIIERFRLPPAKVFVVGEASASVFGPRTGNAMADWRRSLGVDPQGPIVVYVGGFGPHKNVGALVAAFDEIVSMPRFCNARLVLVGENANETFHSEIGAIRRSIHERGLDRCVSFTGFITDEALAALLSTSSVLVLPSLIEGFGLPAIEAAACGCPVIATSESPLPELLGGAAIYFDPRETRQLAAALGRVLDSAELRAQMRAEGMEAAARLSWKAAARTLLGAIETVARQ